MYNEVNIKISNHNNQRNIREKDADLLWNRSSRQRNFIRPPFYCEFNNNNNNNNVYLLSAVPQSQTGLTALYNEIKAGHNNELSKIKMNLK